MGRGGNDTAEITATGRFSGQISTRSGASKTPDQIDKRVIAWLPHFQDEQGNNYGFLRPITTKSGVTLPVIEVGRQQFHAAAIPTDPDLRELAKALIPRLEAGEIHSAERWCEVLQADGVGYKSKQSPDTVRALGEATFRAQVHELAYRMELPMTSLARGDEDELEGEGEIERGFGFADCRDDVRRNCRSLRNRAGNMRAAAEGVRRTTESDGWDFGADNAEVETVIGLTAEQQAAALSALDTVPHTNEQLAMILATGKQLLEIEGRALTPDEHELKERLAGSGVRKIVHNLRLAGVPVCASPASGYWMAQSKEDAIAHADSLDGRADLIEGRADNQERIGAQCFPETEAEYSDLERNLQEWVTAPPRHDPSPEYIERKRKREESSQRRRESDTDELVIAREEARRFRSRHSNTPAYREAFRRVSNAADRAQLGMGPAEDPADVPTDADRRLVRQMENAMALSQGKKRRRAPKGENALSFEIPHEGPAKSNSKIKQASAADLLASAADREARQQPSAKSASAQIDPVPW